jgi:hypothetical protein
MFNRLVDGDTKTAYICSLGRDRKHPTYLSGMCLIDEE